MNTLSEIFKDHLEYKNQLLKLSKAHLDKMYRGAALGKFWAVVKPAVTIFVFWFAIGVGLKKGGEIQGFPFFLWLIAGMCPWFYMSDMLTGGANSIRSYKYLVTKMKFPVSMIPTFVSLSNFAVHIVILLVVMVIFVIFGYMPDIYYLQLPLYMLAMVVFWTFWGVFAGLLAAMSKDFLNMVKSLSRVLFWLSGIIYDARGVDQEWIRIILLFNPVTYIANGYRNVFIYKKWFWEYPQENIYYLLVLAIMFFGMLWAYRKLRYEIPDVL